MLENNSLCYFNKYGNRAIFEKTKSNKCDRNCQGCRECGGHKKNNIFYKKECKSDCNDCHECHEKNKKNIMINLNTLNNWSKAQNLLQINLQRILKVYRSDDCEEFVKDLIQVPDICSRDNFYLFAFRANFKKPYKSVFLLHPFLPEGKMVRQIDYKNGNTNVYTTVTQILKTLEQDKRPLNLTHVSYDCANIKKNAIVVLYKPLKSNTKFDKKCPYYVLGCGFDF